jgi:hypothetical protein
MLPCLIALTELLNLQKSGQFPDEPMIENKFLLSKKYLSMKGVCSVENRILYNVAYVPSLSVADSTNTKYVCVRVYLQNELSDKKRFGGKMRKKMFFLFCFSARPT